MCDFAVDANGAMSPHSPSDLNQPHTHINMIARPKVTQHVHTTKPILTRLLLHNEVATKYRTIDYVRTAAEAKH